MDEKLGNQIMHSITHLHKIIYRLWVRSLANTTICISLHFNRLILVHSVHSSAHPPPKYPTLSTHTLPRFYGLFWKFFVIKPNPHYIYTYTKQHTIT